MLLMGGIELRALRGDIEYVDGLVRFGIDQDNVDVATLFRHGAGQVVEQAGPVLSHNLNEGGGGGRLRIEHQRGLECRPFAGKPRMRAIPQQLTDIGSTEDYSLQGDFQALDFRWIQLEHAHWISECEGVENRATTVGEGLRFQNIHAEAGERSSNARDQERSILGHQRRKVGVRKSFDLDGDWGPLASQLL